MDWPVCPYCKKDAEFVSSRDIYGDHTEYRPMYACRSCEAWVGCHDGTVVPLGTLANKELRRLRRTAHSAFDPVWRRIADMKRISTRQARTEAYQWLATELGLEQNDCHMAQFDEEMCRKVIEVSIRRMRK